MFSECAVETQLSSKKKEKVDIVNNKQVMELFRNSGTPVRENTGFFGPKNTSLHE
jgi:hypothetical protein